MGAGRGVGVLTLAALACRGPTTFACEQDVDCGSEGVCSAGYCGVGDSDCPSGFRYDEFAGGGLAGMCVPGGTGSTTGATGSGSDTLGPTSSTGPGVASTGALPDGPGLLFVDNDTAVLSRFGLPDGPTEALCTLQEGYDSLVVISTSPPMVLASTGERLDAIDPCACTVTTLGMFGVMTMNAMAVDADTGTLYGVSAAVDAVYEIDTMTGVETQLAALDLPVARIGASWLPNRSAMALMDATTDIAYEVIPTTGAMTPLVESKHDFESIGFEIIPDAPSFYGCDNDGVISEVDLATGELLQQFTIGGNCTSMAYESAPMVCAGG